MAPISKHQSAKTTKMLILGDSGSGKSGALAALANAGYNLRIADIDNGLDVLASYLNDPQGGYDPKAHERVEAVTITDTMRWVPMPGQPNKGKLMPQATVWPRLMGLLNDWSPETTAKWGPEFAEGGRKAPAKLGHISTWTERDVFVLDTLSFAADAALKFVLAMNARLGTKAQLNDWGEAQLLVEGLLQMLYDESIKCNVIVNCHVKYIESDGGISKGFPESVGKALSPKIGRYFNSAVLMKTQGKQHKILTQSNSMIELKTSAPMRVKPEYDIKYGLAELFADLRGGEPGSAQK